MAKPTKILIIGNGFGGIYTLKHLKKLFYKTPDVELALIGEKNYFLFTPLLHEVATGGINPENIIEPIREILGDCLSNFYLGKADYVNLAERTVQVGEFLISYDYLVLASGTETNFYNIKGASKYSFQLKSLEDAIKLKNHCITQIENASHIQDSSRRKEKLTFVVVGGGPTGVELAAEMQELIEDTLSNYYSKELITDSSVILIEKGDKLIRQFGEKISKQSLKVLQKKGIHVMLKKQVKEVHPDHIILDDNTNISTENVIWVAGIQPREIKFSEEVAKTQNGRVVVNEYLQLQNQSRIFGLGDVAAFTDKKSNTFLPALAQVAEKEAQTVAKNIELSIKNKALRPFSYQHSGNLVSLGQWMAIGEIIGITFSGGITWWIWRTVYLSKLISFRKKVKVAVDWTVNIFSPRDISQF